VNTFQPEDFLLAFFRAPTLSTVADGETVATEEIMLLRLLLILLPTPESIPVIAGDVAFSLVEETVF
jgi:hypothetical protein